VLLCLALGSDGVPMEGDVQVLLEEATDATNVIDIVAQAERATQQAVDVTVQSQQHVRKLGEGTQLATAATPATPPVTAGNSTNTTAVKKTKKSDKAKTLFAAKVNAYVSKIKKVEKLKKQRWLPTSEQQLASKLVTLDDLSKTTPEERAIEKELRVQPKGVKGTKVELSIRRLKTFRKQKKKEVVAREKQEKLDKKMKAERDLQYAREQKAINAQLRKYRELSVSKKLAKQIKTAKVALKGAVQVENGHKNTAVVKKFSKKYGLNRPVEKEYDYPPGPKQAKPNGKNQAKPNSKNQAKPNSKTLL